MSTLALARPQTTDRRLLSWLFVMNAALLTCYAGFMVIFIPDQVQQIDPANKVANLAIVMTAASIGAIIIHPLIGAFSDRTRSRFGRRTPWMVISAATAALMMVLLSGAGELWTLGVYWVLVMLALNAVATAQAAIVPDRIPRERFGVASGILAMGTFVGMGLGVAGAGLLANSIGIGYAAFGGMILVVTLLFTIFNRDFSSKDLERPPFSHRPAPAGRESARARPGPAAPACRPAGPATLRRWRALPLNSALRDSRSAPGAPARHGKTGRAAGSLS